MVFEFRLSGTALEYIKMRHLVKFCSGRRKEEQSSNLDNSSKIKKKTTLTLTFKTGDLQTLNFRQPDTASEQVQEDRRACLTHKTHPLLCYRADP
jgi:hypothetical protein